jgi:N-acetylmuramoyl-L-alanine amidase
MVGMMNHADYALVALTLWREARGEGTTGMTAVACVIRNRVHKHNSTPFAQCVKKWAFSSITDPKDQQLTLYPVDTDPQWQQAQLIAGNVLDGQTQDITSGATLYYDGSISFPSSWNLAAVKAVGKIGRLNLFREV